VARGTLDTPVFHAVSHPARRRILDLLADRERPAGEIGAHFKRRMTQPAFSQHLRVLRRAGLVTQRRSGRHRLYRANPAPLREVFDWVAHYQRFWDERLAALGRHLERNP